MLGWLRAAAVFAAIATASGCAGSATSNDRAANVDLQVSPQPARAGSAQVVIHVTDSGGRLVHLRHGELFVSWWDPTLGPIQTPPTPMVPMGAMPVEHLIINVSNGPSHYAIPVQFSRPGHWALVFHGVGSGESYATGSRDIVVAP
jgi:hypothetical protein